MPEGTVANTTVQEAIREACRRIVAHFGRADAAAISQMYSKDAVLMPPNNDLVTGSRNIEGFWRGMISTGIKNVDLESKQIEQYGDVIAEIGRYTVFVEQNQVADEGKYLVLWKQENGEWKLFRDIWNSSRPLATP